MESNIMYVKDENGIEKAMEILFTFENAGKNYVVFSDANHQDEQVFASVYNETGDLLPIETQAEWDMVEEVISAFSNEETYE